MFPYRYFFDGDDEFLFDDDEEEAMAVAIHHMQKAESSSKRRRPSGNRVRPDSSVSTPRVRNKRYARETEMASAGAEAAAAAAPAPVGPAEGSVIAINSLDEWSIQIEEATSKNKLVVIDFTASWCPPCRLMAPIFADMAKKNPNVVFLKVDVDEMKAIAEQFSVEAMPTFLFMKEGEGEVKDRVVGAVKEELAKKLELHMAQ